MKDLRKFDRVSLDWVLAHINGLVMRAGSLRALARTWDISAPYLSDVLLGKRNPGPKILKHLGLRCHVVVTRQYSYEIVGKSVAKQRERV